MPDRSHDFRVIEARSALAEARKRDPGGLTVHELQEEVWESGCEQGMPGECGRGPGERARAVRGHV